MMQRNKAQEEKWVGMSPMCVSRVEDEWEMMGMTMGMNRDGTMWAQDEHECGMNVMQPCIAMHGMRRVWCSERK